MARKKGLSWRRRPDAHGQKTTLCVSVTTHPFKEDAVMSMRLTTLVSVALLCTGLLVGCQQKNNTQQQQQPGATTQQNGNGGSTSSGSSGTGEMNSNQSGSGSNY